MEALGERRRHLHDAFLSACPRDDPRCLLDALVQVLSDITNSGTPAEDLEPVDPRQADEVVAGSALVRAVHEANPWLAAAPDAPAVQHWTAVSGHARTMLEPTDPNPDRFRAVADLGDDDLIRPPLPGGLFTSSAPPGGPSMWNLFLTLNSSLNEDANLWRRPWFTWQLVPRPDVRVLRVRSATDWVALVDACPLRRPGDDLVVVDWRDVGTRFDAVHVAATAACALDGLKLRCTHGTTAPAHFTVESTLWLTWCFDSWERTPTP